MPLNSIEEELRRAGRLPSEEEQQPAPKRSLREVKGRQLAIFFVLPMLLIPLSVVSVVHSLSLGEASPRSALAVLFIAVTYLLLRMYAMGCIYMYKAFAPMSVRERCRFIPSCSEYTLISVRRYGILIGVVMGSLRIHRCTPPFGGEDPPRLRHLLRLFHKYEPGCNYTPE